MPLPQKAAEASDLRATAELPEASDNPWGAVDGALDDRQRADIDLLAKNEAAERSKRKKKKVGGRRAADVAAAAADAEDLDVQDADFEQLVRRFCGKNDEEDSHRHSAAKLSQVVRAMSRHVQDADDRVQAAEERVSVEAEARRQAELKQAAAEQRIEELELLRLDFQAEKETWRQREHELSETVYQAQTMSRSLEPTPQPQEATGHDTRRIKELEKMLKEALVRGAKLGRARTDSEEAKADLERQLAKFREAARMKLKKERRRLEAAADIAERRLERAEDRLAEYLQASADGADGVIEAHMQHLAAVGESLANKVEEQGEIIEVLRGLLQDHKDFIRNELGTELSLPRSGGAKSSSSVTRSASSASAKKQPKAPPAKPAPAPQRSAQDESAARAAALGISGPIGNSDDASSDGESGSDDLDDLLGWNKPKPKEASKSKDSKRTGAPSTSL
eukprot:TRINITY_DN32308_c0_g1_i1.p1 TRINITY_DN32308_c0_g1~~TRINITY_DN32308_c0_g1_i1.p1  ORF type:complete len:451 (+),score=152.86 TRINITY_DN32308_c0_g1_i1:77-1429(+)